MFAKSFTIDDETAEILKEFKEKYKIPKSTLIRTLVKYFKNNQEELYKLLIGE